MQVVFHIPVSYVLQNLFCLESSRKGYRYKQLPQRWASSATTFHSRMKALLSLIGAALYIDDIFIWGRTEWEHYKNVRVVIRKLAEAGMHVNDNKS